MSEKELENHINVTLPILKKCVDLFNKTTENIPKFTKMVVDTWFPSKDTYYLGGYGLSMFRLSVISIPYHLSKLVTALSLFAAKNKTSNEYVNYVLNTILNIMLELRQKYNKRMTETLNQPGVREMFKDSTTLETLADKAYLELIEEIEKKMYRLYIRDVQIFMIDIKINDTASKGKTPEQIRKKYNEFIALKKKVEMLYDESNKLLNSIIASGEPTVYLTFLTNNVPNIKKIVDLFSNFSINFQKLMFMANETATPIWEQRVLTSLTMFRESPSHMSRNIFSVAEVIVRVLGPYSKTANADKALVLSYINEIGTYINKHYLEIEELIDNIYKPRFIFSMEMFINNSSHTGDRDRLRKSMVERIDSFYHKDIETIFPPPLPVIDLDSQRVV